MTTVAEHENRLKRMNRFNATGKRKVEESQKRVRRESEESRRWMAKSGSKISWPAVIIHASALHVLKIISQLPSPLPRIR